MITIGGGLRVHEDSRCRNCGAGVQSLRYYDGMLGYQAIECTACGHQEDLNNPKVKKGDTFLTQSECDRCKGTLEGGRTMSWFTEDCICMACSDKERDLRRQLRRAGQDDAALEGCGYVPDPPT